MKIVLVVLFFFYLFYIYYYVFLLNELSFFYFSSFFIFHFNFFINSELVILFGFFFLLTSFFSLFFFNFLGFYGVFVLNLFSIFFFWLSFVPVLNDFFLKNYFIYLDFGRWITLGSGFRIHFDLILDVISISFSFLTISIGLVAYIYAYSYFRYEPNVERLLVFLNLFMISMIFLVTSGNLVCLFLGWEMIGLTSFLLINFWVCRINTFKSAFKAFSFNKASDLFLFFAILLIYNLFFSLDIYTIFLQIPFYSSSFLNFLFFKFYSIDLICFFLILCAFIKSAQFGPHIWLPDSMEAPVPASSLIHSATLVSAGVFLVLRFYSFFEHSVYSLYFVCLVGSITAFLGGFISMHQSDTKKILAYSTISHCGFLMVIAATGFIEYCLLYLYVHGFFKAAVFMCVGNINRFNKNIQDFKKMGYFWKYLPFELFLIFVGLLNLSGLPFSLGFFIKHFLFVALNSSSSLFYFIFVNCIFGAITGLFYSFRLYYNIFFDYKKARLHVYKHSYVFNLNSFFYSNSSLATNLCISFIFFISYIISSYLIYIYSSSFYIFNDFFFFTFLNSYFLNFYPLDFFLENFSYVNYFTLFFISIILYVFWRSVTISNLYFLWYYFFVFCFFMFFLI